MGSRKSAIVVCQYFYFSFHSAGKKYLYIEDLFTESDFYNLLYLRFYNMYLNIK